MVRCATNISTSTPPILIVSPVAEECLYDIVCFLECTECLSAQLIRGSSYTLANQECRAQGQAETVGGGSWYRRRELELEKSDHSFNICSQRAPVLLAHAV